ncbi:Uncharacterized protein BP5553_02537 [Venustampulla echinocandica]|uniref:Integral membrane protein n=1 Tax=Venustampulla echinocandica TaxID=2656787 RepID=A0A370U467_9HELO|nr:Uncharacterized protein BP5553_02537 [Venustampulla echinocandica]RDL42558.1 Uncharacterized protein BP5553_02537 [Venustampulla echinocandica]
MSSLLSLPKDYVPLVVTPGDMKLASVAWGFTLGVGVLTCWKALKQTQRIVRAKRRKSVYVWMIWCEIAACLVFSVLCWLHLNGNIPPSFGFYFGILTCWSLQVQLLLQIIINRIGIIETNTRRITVLKWVVAGIVTVINISVYCIWIPARMQISPAYININDKWDRCEKVIYLIVDMFLNWSFIYTVKRNLVKMGLEKYRSLVHVNIAIVLLSLSMDVLIIGMMSLNNTFVYCQFHPLAYIVKLHIELHLAELIAQIAQRKDRVVNAFSDSNPKHHRSSSKTFPIPLNHLSSSTKNQDLDSQTRKHGMSHGQGIMKTQDVSVSVETYSIGKESTTTSGEVGDFEGGFGRSGQGLASSSTIVGGKWMKSETSVGGDEEPLTEIKTWEKDVEMREGVRFPS